MKKPRLLKARPRAGQESSPSRGSQMGLSSLAGCEVRHGAGVAHPGRADGGAGAVAACGRARVAVGDGGVGVPTCRTRGLPRLHGLDLPSQHQVVEAVQVLGGDGASHLGEERELEAGTSRALSRELHPQAGQPSATPNAGMRAKSLQSCPTQRTVAHQASLSVGFSRHEHWSGLPRPPPKELLHPGIEPTSLATLASGFFTTSAAWETLATPNNLRANLATAFPSLTLRGSPLS